MIDRIREKLFTVRKNKRSGKTQHEILRGNAHNIIVVKAPNDIFTEAIFILRDDYYLTRSASSAELLRQAKAAADGYTASVSVGNFRKRALIILLMILLFTETAVILWMIN